MPDPTCVLNVLGVTAGFFGLPDVLAPGAGLSCPLDVTPCPLDVITAASGCTSPRASRLRSGAGTVLRTTEQTIPTGLPPPTIITLLFLYPLLSSLATGCIAIVRRARAAGCPGCILTGGARLRRRKHLTCLPVHLALHLCLRKERYDTGKELSLTVLEEDQRLAITQLTSKNGTKPHAATRKIEAGSICLCVAIGLAA